MKNRQNRKVSLKCNRCFGFNYQYAVKCRHCRKKFARRKNVLRRFLSFARDEARELFDLMTKAYRKKRSISFDL